MSVEYSFWKDVTMNDLKKINNTKITLSKFLDVSKYNQPFFKSFATYLIERNDDECLEIVIYNGEGELEKDLDKPINVFTGRGFSTELIRDISSTLNIPFITDNELDEILHIAHSENENENVTYELTEEMHNKYWNAIQEKYGLTTIDGKITKKEIGN